MRVPIRNKEDDMSFFFQAEDGIRDYKVTGVQTCALPIYGRYNPHENRNVPSRSPQDPRGHRDVEQNAKDGRGDSGSKGAACPVWENHERSEERRGGKEGRSRWSPDH